QRQALHGLAGRAREHARLYIALRKHHLAIAIHRDDHAAMTAFDEIAARDFNKDGVCHDHALKFPVSGAVLPENHAAAHSLSEPSMKMLRNVLVLFLVIYLMPVLASASYWYIKDRAQT